MSRKQRDIDIKEQIENFIGLHACVLDANKNQDYLKSLTPFQKFTKNGLDLNLYSYWDVPECSEWMFDLYLRNMSDVWSQSYAWNADEKSHELFDGTSHYLIAVNETDPVGFVQFKFEQHGNDIVLFILTIQIEPAVQRKGLGRFFLNALQFIAMDFEAILMTMVYKANASGLEFFEKMKYRTHPSSPDCIAPELEDQHKHVILHKSLAKR